MEQLTKKDLKEFDEVLHYLFSMRKTIGEVLDKQLLYNEEYRKKQKEDIEFHKEKLKQCAGEIVIIANKL